VAEQTRKIMRAFIKMLKDRSSTIWPKIERVLLPWEVQTLKNDIGKKVAYFNPSLGMGDHRKHSLLTKLCGKSETALFNEFFTLRYFNFAFREAR
jgi:hypothetical protein